MAGAAFKMQSSSSSSSSSMATTATTTRRLLPSRTWTAFFRYHSSASAPHLQQPTNLVSRQETGQFQKTLSRAVLRKGVGLHSGDEALLRLLPAAAGQGRYFVRHGHTKDTEERVPAFLSYVKDTTLSTCLGKGSAQVRTIEHLLSALEGLGVDNCRIELEGGNEVPLLDGSAMWWVEAVKEAGICEAVDENGSQVPRMALVIDKPIRVTKDDSFVAAFPAPETRITYGIDFAMVPAIGRQWFSFYPCHTLAYEEQIAPARTFGVYEQIEQLRGAGLIKGGSLENAIVCSAEKGWLNPPLRFVEEPCRHKLLDLIGDLALCSQNGHPGLPIAHIVAFKASHMLHVKFGEALLDTA